MAISDGRCCPWVLGLIPNFSLVSVLFLLFDVNYLIQLLFFDVGNLKTVLKKTR